MREMLFRGKRIDNGEWVIGHVYTQVYCPETIEEEWYWFIKPIGSETWKTFRVDPSTVGQYTGMTDKNGKRIFEGDVFRYGFDEVAAVAVVKFGEFGFGSQFDMNQVGFYAEWNPREMYYRADLGFWVKQREIEVIGNIHDNPELVKEEPT